MAPVNATGVVPNRTTVSFAKSVRQQMVMECGVPDWRYDPRMICAGAMAGSGTDGTICSALTAALRNTSCDERSLTYNVMLELVRPLNRTKLPSDVPKPR